VRDGDAAFLSNYFDHLLQFLSSQTYALTNDTYFHSVSFTYLHRKFGQMNSKHEKNHPTGQQCFRKQR